MSQIRKVVIPVAGLGTRFLPATKAVPKEMLPVVDTPAIQYVVEEAVAAGLTDVLMITGRNKGAIEDHFDDVAELTAALEAKGDADRIARVRRSTELADVHFVRQGAPLGLGHAVGRAREHVGGEAFAVQLGDDLIDSANPLLPDMIATQEHLGGSVIALMEVPREQISLYGSAVVEPADLVPGTTFPVHRVTGLVEKPAPEEAPSTLAAIGRYVLHPAVFDVLDRTAPGHGGEIQLTDALATLAGMPASEGGGVHGVVFSGKRYDTGDRLDYLKAVVQLALERPDLGPPLREWLAEHLAE
ncbi:UTP--glucose-1-phosphate uridylyltransferase [Pseudactinotalea sp. HY160]|uniref:UTP--glucose-1-phosphate uridylyltransferase n=1 Tax=Pseudactinotalea sp. HY160 TaxID=2654490 RepID=UPI00128CEBF2|nr:UTP--glucose-1-phosphate uridylyltransferase [Pseudactinotalea sp. HY160]MPV48602.1 UTP--glucose-1-phosphate uridylyltransferase [Pseudactinotalea sp. HY160]